MNDAVKKYFDENRYVYLTGAIAKEKCAELTKHMFSLLEQKKLVRDEQCPKSWSVYGDPIFDSILADLAKPLSDQLGVELTPTYTYARIYQPGEVLVKHTDRESCEISGTLTLGFDPDSELWPIYFANHEHDVLGKQIMIGVGDLVMYRGNELPHWRTEYKGKWQCQVFFHFVDANGPHKEFKYDKRENLGTDKTKPKQIPNITPRFPIYNGVMIPSWESKIPGACNFSSKFKPELTFTKEQCEKIINLGNELYSTKASVGAGTEGKFNPNVRLVEQYQIVLNNNTKWIFDKIVDAVSIANHEYYNYDIMGITHELQLLHYKSDERAFYDWHTDVGNGEAVTRKISVSIHLSDPSDYEGGDLVVNDHGTVINTLKEQGCINMFPSYQLHQVTPVTKGERWVIVSWVHGSHKFR